MDGKVYPKARRLLAVIGNSSYSGRTGRVRVPKGKSRMLEYIKRCICGRPIHTNHRKCSYCLRLARIFVKPHMVAGHYRKVR